MLPLGRNLMAVGRSKPVAKISFWKLALNTLYVTLLSVLVDARLVLPAASVAAPAGTLTTTVPLAVIPDTATLYVVPLPVTVAVVAPAVPLSVTSPVAKPVTVSLKVTVKLIGLALVGSPWPAAWLIVTLGAALSMV